MQANNHLSRFIMLYWLNEQYAKLINHFCSAVVDLFMLLKLLVFYFFVWVKERGDKKRFIDR
ncbi:hypothetical protein YA28_17740 [Klebsiella aerogenes]|nr:hypothetical protein YA28_17740 [Klebsiella aerogenes]KUQ24900.1 hypothetical protein AWI09_23355 [Klebsiella aerogenes]KUR21508.1 hypothetical protein AWI35_22325 [Klebsiella aerogenes]